MFKNVHTLTLADQWSGLTFGIEPEAGSMQHLQFLSIGEIACHQTFTFRQRFCNVRISSNIRTLDQYSEKFLTGESVQKTILSHHADQLMQRIRARGHKPICMDNPKLFNAKVETIEHDFPGAIKQKITVNYVTAKNLRGKINAK